MSKKSLQAVRIMNEAWRLSDIAFNRLIECGEKHPHETNWWRGYLNALDDIKDYIDDLIGENNGGSNESNIE